MVVAFEWTTLSPTGPMPRLPANTWVIAVLRTATPILAAEIHTGILTATPTVTVIRTRAVEAMTETETEILMAATAETGANVAAHLLRAVDDTHPSTEGEEVIQEVLPEVAAPQEAVSGIMTLQLRLPPPQPRTVRLMPPVGKVVLFDWPLLFSSIRIQDPGRSARIQTDQGQRQGQRSN